jgi:hypothetical protein
MCLKIVRLGAGCITNADGLKCISPEKNATSSKTGRCVERFACSGVSEGTIVSLCGVADKGSIIVILDRQTAKFKRVLLLHSSAGRLRM